MTDLSFHNYADAASNDMRHLFNQLCWRIAPMVDSRTFYFTDLLLDATGLFCGTVEGDVRYVLVRDGGTMLAETPEQVYDKRRLCAWLGCVTVSRGRHNWFTVSEMHPLSDLVKSA